VRRSPSSFVILCLRVDCWALLTAGIEGQSQRSLVLGGFLCPALVLTIAMRLRMGWRSPTGFCGSHGEDLTQKGLYGSDEAEDR